MNLRLCWTDPVTGVARSVPLAGALRLGSNRQNNDVVLPLRSVEAFHAEILGDRDGGWELVALGARRLKVGEAMTARARLSAGTEFSVGPVAFRVRPEEDVARRPVSSTGSRRAFAPPSPPPPAPAAEASRWPLAAGLLLVAATGVATWSALRDRGPGPSEPVKAASSPAAPAGRARPKARPAARPAPLEAGAPSLHAETGEPHEAGDGAVPVLVNLAGASVRVRGFFVSPDGRIVTNHRLVASADSIFVEIAGAAPVPARLVASDPARDLALLEAAVTGPVSVAPLDADDAMRTVADALGVPASGVRAFVASSR